MGKVVLTGILILILLLFTGCDLENNFNVGGIFTSKEEETIFTTVINLMNERYHLQVIPLTYVVPSSDPLETYKITCQLLSFGIIGLFGPSVLRSSPYVHSVLDFKEIPHIETNCDPNIKRGTLVNLYPHPRTFSYVFHDLINLFEWTKIMVLYDDEDSLLSVSSLLELNSEGETTVVLKKLEEDDNSNYRPMLLDIKFTGERLFVVACSAGVLRELFSQLQQVGMITDKYSYIIAGLDVDVVDLSPFQYAGTNITAVRMFHSDASWNFEAALLSDAVHLFYETLNEYLVIKKEQDFWAYPMDCRDSSFWVYGYTIINKMRTKLVNGLTGPIKFDIEGLRTDFSVDILELSVHGLVKVGEWNSTTRKTSFQRLDDVNVYKSGYVVPENPFNRTFTVLISITPPYGMLKEETSQLIGNDRYEGYGIDVIQELSRILGFNYTFVLQEDGNYGVYDKNTNEWNGMIKEIMDGRADLAITDLTITSERENAVDFTMPFMSLGIGILYRKPEPVPPSLFMFISPFSTSVWVMLCVSYFIVSVSFFIMSRLSPYEWQNLYPCVEEPEVLENQFSVRNSFWFTMGSLMQQGSELAPVAISTRTASGAWWFFVLIITSSYTANLAAFLTVETLVTPFKDIEELASQTEIKYGAKTGGATVNFFRDSNISVHHQVSEYMRKHKDLMMSDNDAGVAKVENENYAFFMESTSIEYVTERHCILAQVGGLLDEKGYGIAMKKNSEYRGELSEAVLQLQEQGVLTKLKIKWWKEKRGGGKCSAKPDQSETTPLDLQHLGGVFLVLLIGTILSVLGSFAETAYKVHKKSKSGNLSFKEELQKEMAFFLKFKQNVREVSLSVTESASTKDSGDDKTVHFVK